MQLVPPHPEAWDNHYSRFYNWGEPLQTEFTKEQRRLREQLEFLMRSLIATRMALKEHNMGILTKSKTKGTKNNGLALLSAFPPEKTNAMIMAVVNGGHNISFSQTRAGNALVVAVYDGKDNDKVYPETVEDLEEVFQTIMDAYDASYEAPPPPSPVRRTAKSKGTG